ncbi:MAG: hypothetical protein ACRDQA_25215 [Nocardioidaceae bacterium]
MTTDRAGRHRVGFRYQLRDRRRHQPTSAATPRSVDLLSCVGEVGQKVTIALDQLAGVDPAELDLPRPRSRRLAAALRRHPTDATPQGPTEDAMGVSFDDTHKRQAEELQERIAAIREDARRRPETSG